MFRNDWKMKNRRRKWEKETLDKRRKLSTVEDNFLTYSL